MATFTVNIPKGTLIKITKIIVNVNDRDNNQRTNYPSSLNFETDSDSISRHIDNIATVTHLRGNDYVTFNLYGNYTIEEIIMTETIVKVIKG